MRSYLHVFYKGSSLSDNNYREGRVTSLIFKALSTINQERTSYQISNCNSISKTKVEKTPYKIKRSIKLKRLPPIKLLIAILTQKVLIYRASINKNVAQIYIRAWQILKIKPRHLLILLKIVIWLWRNLL